MPFLLMPLINLAARHDMHVLSIGLLIFMLAPLSFGAMTYSGPDPLL